MKKKALGIIAAILVISIAAAGIIIASGGSRFWEAGTYFREAAQKDDDKIVAAYKDYQIFQSDINYHKNMFSWGNSVYVSADSDLDIIKRIITGYILLEEAELKGMAATEAEIQEMVDAARASYEIPEGRKILDDYCNGAGITFAEYLTVLEEQAPATITRQKLKNEFTREYCEEHNIEYDNFSEEVSAQITAEYDKYRDALIETNRADIVYYLDE